MRQLAYLLALALIVAGAVEAAADGGGSASNPLFVRKSQGTIRDQKSVECSVDTALLTAAETENVLSIYCQNMETTADQRIGICPRVAAAGACDGETKWSALVNSGEGWTTDVSSPGPWSCNGVSGTYTLNCYLERFARPSTGGPIAAPSSPTPTAIPTPTPTPTP